MKYLRPSDKKIMNRNSLLEVSKNILSAVGKYVFFANNYCNLVNNYISYKFIP